MFKLIENSVLRNKALNVNNSFYFAEAHREKITENITPEEPHESNKTEQNVAISEKPVQLEN